MKVDHLRDEGFKHIKMVVVIETEDELLEWYHRSNISFSKLKSVPNYHAGSVPFPERTSHNLMFEFLDKEVSARGLDELSI